MIETHTIRLRGPWQCDVGGQQSRFHVPVQRRSVVRDDYRGRLSCRRRFGCPTCLDPHERVWLVIEEPARPGEAMLNSQPLGAFQIIGDSSEFDITGRLRERNELVLDLDFARPFSGTTFSNSGADELLFKEVRLEIRG
jgi:hypothetical protein